MGRIGGIARARRCGRAAWWVLGVLLGAAGLLLGRGRGGGARAADVGEANGTTLVVQTQPGSMLTMYDADKSEYTEVVTSEWLDYYSDDYSQKGIDMFENGSPLTAVDTYVLYLNASGTLKGGGYLGNPPVGITDRIVTSVRYYGAQRILLVGAAETMLVFTIDAPGESSQPMCAGASDLWALRPRTYFCASVNVSSVGGPVNFGFNSQPGVTAVFGNDSTQLYWTTDVSNEYAASLTSYVQVFYVVQATYDFATSEWTTSVLFPIGALNSGGGGSWMRIEVTDEENIVLVARDLVAFQGDGGLGYDIDQVYEVGMDLAEFNRTGYPLLTFSYDTSDDPFDVRRDPFTGLLYVSDYTGFNLPLAFTQDGTQVGSVGSSYGYLGGASFLTILYAPFAAKCSFYGVPTSVRAGELVQFYLLLRDAAGGAWPAPTDVNVTLTMNVAVDDDVFTAEFDEFQYEWVGNGTGAFRVFFTPTLASAFFYADPANTSSSLAFNPSVFTSSYDNPNSAAAQQEAAAVAPSYAFTLSATVGVWDAVVPETHKMYVSPGNVSIDTTELNVSGVTFTAGGNAQLSVQLYDAYGNGVYTTGAEELFSFSVNGLPLRYTDYLNATVVDAGYGLYHVNVNSQRAGLYLVEILYGGGELRESPFSTVVLPAELSGSKSLLAGEGTQYVELGTAMQVVVVPRDSYGNAMQYQAAYETNPPFNVTVVPHDSKYVANVTVTYTPDGTAGDFEIHYEVSPASGRKARNDDNVKFVTLTVNATTDGVALSTVDGDKSPLTVYQTTVYKDVPIDWGIQGVGLSLAMLGLAMTVVYAALVTYFREENVIRFSQIKYLYIILFGIALGFVSVTVVFGHLSRLKCSMSRVFVHMSFMFTACALLIKTWKVSKIANNQSLRRVKISDTKLLMVLAATVLVSFCYVLTWTIVEPPNVNNRTSYRDTDDETGVTTEHRVSLCRATASAWAYVWHSVEALVLAYNLLLCYETRNVHSAFAEAKWLALAVYNFTSVGILLLIIILALDSSSAGPSVEYLIFSVCIFLSIGGTLNLIFAPKMYSIYKNEEVSIQDFITSRAVRSGTSVTRGGSGGSGGARSHSNSDDIPGDTASIISKTDGAMGAGGRRTASGSPKHQPVSIEVPFTQHNPIQGHPRTSSADQA